MQQQDIFKPVPRHRLQSFSKEEIIELFEAEQRFRIQIEKDIDRLRAQNEELRQKRLLIEEQYITLKNKFFGKSSEKEPSKQDRKKSAKGRKGKKRKVQLPSLRYPDAPLIEREVELENLPICNCCSHEMVDSGMTENVEYITVIPAQYMVIRQKRHKYRCDKCHGSLVTAPAPPRIKPGSGYSDEMIIDVAMSKYCDLVPIERYATIAGREGFEDLPPQSLIQQTHHLADFVKGAYGKLKEEVLAQKVLHADETPHRMLEGHGDKSWYLWGFSGPKSSYFEIKNTRSGDVASNLLTKSNCEYLVSDVFSGYNKAVTVTNKEREKQGKVVIRNTYCNAHARRRFKEALDKFPVEAQFFVDSYKEIYRIRSECVDKSPEESLRRRHRSEMGPIFEAMKARAMENIKGYSSKSSIGKAMSYFLKNYEGLTLFLSDPELPIDNNHQERQLRNPVIGRKTWYGTHSKRGAKTTAILFSLVESCKLCQINPREYFKKLVQDLHQGKNPKTPKEYINL